MRDTVLGPLPNDWEVHALGTLARLSTGGTPSRERSEYWNGSIPWVKTGEVNYRVIRSTEESISRAGIENSSAKVYPPGTLLVAMYGQGVTRGRAAILGIDAAINQACAAITVGKELDVSFLFFAFRHQYQSIRDLGHGANQQNLNMQILRDVKFPAPPIEEQRAIAHVLRTVQRAKEATEKVIAATRQLKASLMRHLFTYGPVPVDHAERVELKETEIGLVPESWRVVDLGDAIVETQYGLSQRGEASGTFPILRMNNLNGGRISAVDLQYVNLSDDDFRKYKLVFCKVRLTPVELQHVHRAAPIW